MHTVTVADAAVDINVHNIAPVFERGAAEERHYRRVQRAKMEWVVLLKKDHAKNCKNVEEEEEDQPNIYLFVHCV